LEKIRAYFLLAICSIYNRLFSRRAAEALSVLPELSEIRQRARVRTDFSDHLETLFAETYAKKPAVIVELGTRGGDSTFVLERVARLCQAEFISVDIADCRHASAYAKWRFVQADDVVFAGEFAAWCRERKLRTEIDILFIDTSHVYKHTVQEIQNWFPLLAPDAKVMLHDTNLRVIYRRGDGSIGAGWNNRRGVIHALEDYFGCRFAETRPFTTVQNGWLIRHLPACNGFTVLECLPARASSKVMRRGLGGEATRLS
jgi:predicted O-methyltransferase YrrM